MLYKYLLTLKEVFYLKEERPCFKFRNNQSPSYVLSTSINILSKFLCFYSLGYEIPLENPDDFLYSTIQSESMPKTMHPFKKIEAKASEK
jgi:hypothetical protein